MTPNEPEQPRPDDLENRLRRTLSDGPPPVDTEGFLTAVHQGARSRRRRRVAGSALAAAAVIVVGAFAVTSAGIFDRDATTAADGDRTPTLSTATPTTTDPSSSTTSQPTPTQLATARALSLSATDGDHQYVLTAGKFGCRGACLRASTTDDGGQTWTITAPLGLHPSDPDPTTQTAYAIRFADESNGWVFGGGLRSTHDGGSSWRTPTLPADGIVTTLEAWGDRVYAGVYDDPSGTTTLLRSSAGADDWQAVDVGQPVRLLTAMAVSQQATALLSSPTQVSDDNQLLVSTDDSTWSDVSPCHQKHDWPSAVSATADSLWTVCSGSRSATAYVSTDDGHTWSTVPGAFHPGTQIQARDDHTAVVLDAYKSGLTLVAVDSSPQRLIADQGDLLAIGFTNPTTGYVRTMDDRILRTVDSGATWQPYPLP